MVMRTDSEPELAVGIRLFWAIIFVVSLVVGVPILIGRVLPSAPHAAPETMAQPEVLTDRDSIPMAVSSQELPKAQAPPLELLQGSFGRLSLK
jgi:hypothetical protein